MNPPSLLSRSNINRTGPLLVAATIALGFWVIFAVSAKADSYTTTSVTTSWASSRWNNSADASPYTSAYTPNNNVSFTSGNYVFNTGIGSGTINIGNVSLLDNVTVSFTGTIAGTYGTGGAVRTLTVGTGAIFDLAGQSISTAAGTGFIKNGAGILKLAGSAYTGGFTLNAGTVILGGINAMGQGALTINGGIIAANADRSVTARYTSFTVGGNFQIGGVTTGVTSGDGSATANISFADNVSLGAATRTITIGANGTYTFSGILSGSAGTGLTVDALSGATGILLLSGTSANTYSGATTVNAGELDLGKTAVNAVAGNLVVGDGAGAASSAITKLLASNQIANASGVTVNSDGTLNIQTFSDTVGTVVLAGGSISGSTGVLTGSSYDVRSGSASAILGGAGVNLAKTTSGTVTLTGANTYTGTTQVTGGTLLVNGNQSTATGAMTVTSSGSVLGGTGTVGGTVTLVSGSTLQGGAGTATGALTLTKAVDTSDGIIQLALGTSGTHSSLIDSGGQTWAFGSTQLFNFIDLGATVGTTYSGIITGLPSDPGSEANWTIQNDGWMGTFVYNGGNIDFNLTAVPEPSTWVAGLLTLAALGYTQRRRFCKFGSRNSDCGTAGAA